MTIDVYVYVLISGLIGEPRLQLPNYRIAYNPMCRTKAGYLGKLHPRKLVIEFYRFAPYIAGDYKR